MERNNRWRGHTKNSYLVKIKIINQTSVAIPIRAILYKNCWLKLCRFLIINTYREAVIFIQMQVFDRWWLLMVPVAFRHLTRPITNHLCLLFKTYIWRLDFFWETLNKMLLQKSQLDGKTIMQQGCRKSQGNKKVWYKLMCDMTVF